MFIIIILITILSTGAIPTTPTPTPTPKVPPGYELVSLVEALNGPLAAPQPPAPTLTLTRCCLLRPSYSPYSYYSYFPLSETTDPVEGKKKKSRRRGSREQRDKERAERRVVSVSAPPPVGEVSRKYKLF